MAVAVIIPVKKAFAILKGRNHNGTSWCHLDKSRCEASEQTTDSMVTIDFTERLEHGAALPRWFCNSIDMNAMWVLSVAEVPDNTQPRNCTPLEIKDQTIKFWDFDL